MERIPITMTTFKLLLFYKYVFYICLWEVIRNYAFTKNFKGIVDKSLNYL